MDLNTLFKSALTHLKHDSPDIIDFSVNDWGSCQYTTALNTFNILNKLEANYGFETTLHIMNIKMDITPRTFDKMKKDFLHLIEMRYSGSPWSQEDYEEKMNMAEQVTSIEGMFDFCRNSSWDLWTTAPFIFELCFPEFAIKFPYENDEDFINFETGFYCWIIHCLYGVEEEAFKNYDT